MYTYIYIHIWKMFVKILVFHIRQDPIPDRKRPRRCGLQDFRVHEGHRLEARPLHNHLGQRTLEKPKPPKELGPKMDVFLMLLLDHNWCPHLSIKEDTPSNNLILPMQHRHRTFVEKVVWDSHLVVSIAIRLQNHLS